MQPALLQMPGNNKRAIDKIGHRGVIIGPCCLRTHRNREVQVCSDNGHKEMGQVIAAQDLFIG